MSSLRVGVIGAGFWARYQIRAWQQIPGVEIVAITNRTLEKARVLAGELGIPIVSASPEELVALSEVEVVDIITSESAHHEYTLLAAKAGKHVTCQKPMAESPEECREMVEACAEAGVRLLIHDNWRYQSPIRSFLEWYREQPAGPAYRGRFSYLSSFPVFEMQPALRDARRFMLMDMGTHIIDTARAFMGDIRSVAAQTAAVTPGIAGEDLATVLAATNAGTHFVVELSYASPTELEHELETLIVLECESGVMALGHDFRAVLTTRDGRSVSRRFPPVTHEWLIPRYTLSMGSCLPANRAFFDSITAGTPSESEGSSYLNTMQAVFAAYESAQTQQVIELNKED